MADITLAIDIGNTNIKFGIFKDDRLRTSVIRTHPIRERVFYERRLRGFIKEEKPDGVVLSSVVPKLNRTFSSIVKEMTGMQPLLVDSSVRTGLRFRVKEPRRMGADRIANAAGGYGIAGGSVAVVDFGSATTMTVVEGDGSLIGGSIMPGIGMMCMSLKEHTGKLPLVRPSLPVSPLGLDTESSIVSGVLYGTAGAVERLLEETAASLGGFMTIITGGNAVLIKDLLRAEFKHIPDLTLIGLKMILEEKRA